MITLTIKGYNINVGDNFINSLQLVDNNLNDNCDINNIDNLAATSNNETDCAIPQEIGKNFNIDFNAGDDNECDSIQKDIINDLSYCDSTKKLRAI